MTPEKRATDYLLGKASGFSSTQRDEIAALIRDAVAEENEECRQLAIVQTVHTSRHSKDYCDGYLARGREIGTAIEARRGK